MHHLKLKRATGAALVCAVAAGLAGARQAHANLTIVPTWDSTITNDVANGATIQSVINSAIAEYNQRFTDNITVQIKFAEMGSGLGQSSFYYGNYAYSTIRTALGNDA